MNTKNAQHSSVLKVENLVKKFPVKKIHSNSENSFTALNGISFNLNEGEILGILGPNGAGKTTTIQILLSVLTPTSGSIIYFGKDFYSHRSEVLEHVSFASSYVKLPPQLKVSENLDIYAQLYGLSSSQRAAAIEKYLKIFGMWNIAHKETGVLSAGQMTRVMLAKAFISNPKIILLDEPTASLDPDIAHDVRAYILEQQKAHNLSILVTSHNMDEVTQICDRVLVLKKGEIIANDTPENLALSVSRTRITLTSQQLDSLTQFAHSHDLKHTRNMHSISIEVDEQDIAALLMSLAGAGIGYSQISIDKPTLEDYFLSIAREKHPEASP